MKIDFTLGVDPPTFTYDSVEYATTALSSGTVPVQHPDIGIEFFSADYYEMNFDFANTLSDYKIYMSFFQTTENKWILNTMSSNFNPYAFFCAGTYSFFFNGMSIAYSDIPCILNTWAWTSMTISYTNNQFDFWIKAQGGEWQNWVKSFTPGTVAAGSYKFQPGNNFLGIINSISFTTSMTAFDASVFTSTCYSMCDITQGCISLDSTANRGCFDCASGYFLISDVSYAIGNCFECDDVGCKSCNGAGTSQCTLCDTTSSFKYLDQPTSTCKDACSAGEYIDSVTLAPGLTCATCEDENCKECSGAGTSKCLVCMDSDPSYHKSEFVSSEGFCINACEGITSYFKFVSDYSTKHCLQCSDSGCKVCSGEGENKCIQCIASGSFPFRESDDLETEGTCKQACSSGYEEVEDSGFKYCIKKQSSQQTKRSSSFSTAGLITAGISAVVIGVSVIVDFFKSGNLTNVWILSGYMQIITLFSIIQLKRMPTILIEYWNSLALVSSMNALPNIVNIFNPNPEDIYDRPNNMKYNPNIKGLNFSTNIGQTLTTIFILVCIYGVFLIFSIFCGQYYKIFGTLKRKFEFNGAIRTFMMVFFIHVLASLVQLRYGISFDVNDKVFKAINTIISIPWIMLCCIFVGIGFLFIHRHKEEIEEESMSDRYESWYCEFKSKGMGKYSGIIVLLRRLLSILLLLLFDFSPIGGSILFFGVTILQFGWIIALRPYRAGIQNVLAILNEVSLVFIHILFIVLVIYDFGNDTVDQLGNRIFLLMQIVVYCNLVAIMTGGVMALIRILKKWWKKRKAAKLQNTTLFTNVLNIKDIKDLPNKKPIHPIKVNPDQSSDKLLLEYNSGVTGLPGTPQEIFRKQRVNLMKNRQANRHEFFAQIHKQKLQRFKEQRVNPYADQQT